jgi:guanylate kinase
VHLVVLAGPSAVGKSTVVAQLKATVPDLFFSVSWTTRDPRPGEVDGRDYHYVSRDRFRDEVDSGLMLEWAEIHGGLQLSGTPRQPVTEALQAGPSRSWSRLTWPVPATSSAMMPEALTVFLAPPTWEDLVERLTGRGTESEDVIRRRLETAREELASKDEFDRVVVNRDVTEAVAEISALLTGHVRTVRLFEKQRCGVETNDNSTVFDPAVGITNPPIDDLLTKVSSKYALVIFAAKRARQINNYFQTVGDGVFEFVGPLVTRRPTRSRCRWRCVRSRATCWSTPKADHRPRRVRARHGPSSPSPGDRTSGRRVTGLSRSRSHGGRRRWARLVPVSENNLNVLVGVGGGIAAYKSGALVRYFTEAGHDVHVIPTESALRFVGAATFEALSGQPGVHHRLRRRRRGPPRPARAGRRPDRRGPGDRGPAGPPGARPGGRPADRQRAGCHLPGGDGPGDAHRDVAEPGHPGERGDPAPPRHTVLEPAHGRLTGVDSGAGRLPEPEHIGALALGGAGALRNLPSVAGGPSPAGHRRRHT